MEARPTTPLRNRVIHTPATGASNKGKWDDKDTQAKVIITNCLELSQVSHITSKATSKES